LVLAVALGCGGAPAPSQGVAEAPRTSADGPKAARPDTGPSAAASVAPFAPQPVSSAAPTTAAASAMPSQPPSNAPITIATSKAHTEGRHYVLDAKSPAGVTVGGSGALEIVLVAKDGYHINEEFPYKLRTAVDPAGVVSFEDAELARAKGTFTKTEARFSAKFAGAKAGDAKIGGTIAFSVCTAKECVVDKVQLEVPVTVR
jgi:hypothetical protein